MEKNELLGQKRKSETQIKGNKKPNILNDEKNQNEPSIVISKNIIEENEIYLKGLPLTSNYFKSYNHKENLTDIISCNKTKFLITFSTDGIIKFWKINNNDIEYIKTIKAYTTKITGISVNNSEKLLAVCCHKDNYIKLMDIENYDIIDYIELNYFPSKCEFISNENIRFENILLISEKSKGCLHVFNINNKKDIQNITNIYTDSVITALKFNYNYNIYISCTNTGMIEYTDIIDFTFPKKHIKFDFKIETDLFILYDKSKKNNIINIIISPKGNYFCVIDKKKNIYLFDFLKGKKINVLNNENKNNVNTINENIDNVYYINAQFDQNEKYLYYPTKQGIKLVDIFNNQLICLLGKKEKLEFINLALYQPYDNSNKNNDLVTSIVFTTSLKCNKFFLFTKNEPDNKLQRDIDEEAKNI